MLRLVDASWEIVAAAVAVASRFHSMLVYVKAACWAIGQVFLPIWPGELG